jgi:hypothetical protein
VLSPNEYYVQAARREEIQRDIERAAQRAAARLAHEDTYPLHAQALARVGKVMVDVGSKLQARYGTLIEDANHTPANV